MNERTDRTGSKGFTLIETVVAVGVVGTLVALTAAGLSSSRATARSTACQANLRSLGTGIQMYRDANREQLPSFTNFPGTLADKNYQFTKSIASYLETPGPSYNPADGTYSVVPHSIFLCLGDRDADARAKRPGSYNYFPHVAPSPYYGEGRPIIGDIEGFHWGKQNGVGIEKAPALFDYLPLDAPHSPQ